MRQYFDLNDIFQEVRQSKMYSEHFERVQTFKVNSLKELCGRLPVDNEIFFLETRKSFTAFTFIVYVIKTCGYVKSKGLIGTIHFHISETLKFRMPEIFARLVELAKDGVITLTYAWTHKKVACLETENGCYVIEGSGNYGENALEEQYVFLKSKKVYEFRIGN